MFYKIKAQQRIKKAKENREQREKEKTDKLIKELKKEMKEEEQYIDLCKEYNEDIDFIDDVNISFAPLDVSAKTVNGDIFLNDRLLNDSKEAQKRYATHELTHVLQQKYNKVSGKVDKKHYLDDENEIEAFNNQISFMCDNENFKDVQEYIENLLDHHHIKGKEREEKAKKLVEDI